MAQRFIKIIDKYIGTLTDETDPDIVIARLDITIIEEKQLLFHKREHEQNRNWSTEVACIS